MSAEARYEKHTRTYKTVEECEIKADVYRLPGDDIRPALVYIHGGALIHGSRQVLEYVKPLLNAYLEAGFVVVAIDYRLAPETKLAGIVEDISDAINWTRKTGPTEFKVDPNRIAVVGHSAGGFLTLVTGFCVTPRPQVLVSYSGYGRVSGRAKKREFSEEDRVSEEEAYAGIGSAPISECFLRPDHLRARKQFLKYCHQNGFWGAQVVGHDPNDSPEEFERFSLIHQIDEDFPPTFLVHGAKDTDVSHEASVAIERELKRNNVECGIHIVPHQGHKITDTKAYDASLRFLKKNIGK